MSLKVVYAVYSVNVWHDITVLASSCFLIVYLVAMCIYELDTFKVFHFEMEYQKFIERFYRTTDK